MKDGVDRGVVLADAGYGLDGAFRAGVTALGLTYAVGVQSTLTVWPPGEEPLPPKPWTGRGRKPSRLRHDDEHRGTVGDVDRSLQEDRRRGGSTPPVLENR